MENSSRFFNKVLFTSDCWEWQGAKYPNGYGSFAMGKTSIRAHRFSYELYNGVIPQGLVLDHLCRNTSCVNPIHLEAVTQKENMQRGSWAQRTHCPQGHEYAGDNLVIDINGHRRCKICKNNTWKKWSKK